ncbi:hypothetical protein [Clostridium fungisolvens]|uniref:Uncharacterized protein n=1 Tax=Clostridium fungisolvens TaxID=1604897 RepID=A0A6V8SII7_9CLOT|nr:hypothetical protein [Clostridium fungisolvens]GFP76335.1 hypothetical protein bsdtw1_02437 [Clostridium fungisolvens]
MRKMANIIFLILGAILLILEFHFMFDGTLGWLITSSGVILFGIGIFKGNNPLRVILQFIVNFF